MRIDYIIHALCPRTADTNDWRSVSLAFIRSILLFILSFFLILLYPGSCASHGGEFTYPFFPSIFVLKFIRVP
jgi:hypothetical protein